MGRGGGGHWGGGLRGVGVGWGWGGGWMRGGVGWSGGCRGVGELEAQIQC